LIIAVFDSTLSKISNSLEHGPELAVPASEFVFCTAMLVCFAVLPAVSHHLTLHVRLVYSHAPWGLKKIFCERAGAEYFP
jgi:hypothetical protein